MHRFGLHQRIAVNDIQFQMTAAALTAAVGDADQQIEMTKLLGTTANQTGLAVELQTARQLAGTDGKRMRCHTTADDDWCLVGNTGFNQWQLVDRNSQRCHLGADVFDAQRIEQQAALLLTPFNLGKAGRKLEGAELAPLAGIGFQHDGLLVAATLVGQPQLGNTGLLIKWPPDIQAVMTRLWQLRSDLHPIQTFAGGAQHFLLMTEIGSVAGELANRADLGIADGIDLIEDNGSGIQMIRRHCCF